jgi:hypothetical protein
MAQQGGFIAVDGIREVNRSLKALGEDTSAVKKANVDAANTLIRAALPLVPTRSGRLKSTIRPVNALNYAAARAGITAVPYAGPIHWGWARVGARHKGKLTPGGPRSFRNIKPQPFFSKALGYTYQEIMDNYERNMNAIITKHKLR